jgi:hypothetical protein
MYLAPVPTRHGAPRGPRGRSGRRRRSARRRRSRTRWCGRRADGPSTWMDARSAPVSTGVTFLHSVASISASWRSAAPNRSGSCSLQLAEVRQHRVGAGEPGEATQGRPPRGSGGRCPCRRSPRSRRIGPVEPSGSDDLVEQPDRDRAQERHLGLADDEVAGHRPHLLLLLLHDRLPGDRGLQHERLAAEALRARDCRVHHGRLQVLRGLVGERDGRADDVHQAHGYRPLTSSSMTMST